MPRENPLARLGRRVAALRGDVSQREFASRAELDPGTVSRVERGAMDPSISTLAKVASALGVTLEDIIRDSDPPVDPRTMEIIENWGHLLGTCIQHARVSRSMKIEDLARKSRVSPIRITSIERGLLLPDLRTLWMIAGVLSCSIDELVGRGSPPGLAERVAKAEAAIAEIQKQTDVEALQT